MNKIIRKFLGLFLLLFVLFLSSCGETKFNADTIKSNLEKNGYKVEMNPYIENVDMKQFEGLENVIYGYNDEYGVLLLVFDSTTHATNLTKGPTLSKDVSIICDWGKDHSKDETRFMGVVNNVFYAGDNEIRKASGVLGTGD